MNIYLVVEGLGEKKVYPKWIRIVNPKLRCVNEITAVHKNHVYIVSGGGYPSYFQVIEDAVEDVSINASFDRLVVAVDSEELSYHEKRKEIASFIDGLKANVDYHMIIQHFCLETWALGNRVIVQRQPKTTRVRQYRAFYDVLTEDPAALPSFEAEELTRAQFAERYLRSLLNEKYRNLSYSKRNPKALFDQNYFKRIKSRFMETGHIASFEEFLKAFV